MREGGSQVPSGCGDVVFVTTACVSMGFVHPVAKVISDAGPRVHLVSGDQAPSANYPHTSSVLPMSRSWSPVADARALPQWVQYFRRVKPRMVVAGTPKASLLSLVAARIAGVPSRVYVIHGAVWDGATGRRARVLLAAERTTIAASTHQLAVSDSLARLIHARGLSRDVPTVLGSGSFCGIDVDRFAPPDLTDGVGPKMCFVGRINRDKGIDVLLRTLDRVREHVPARLTVVGGLDVTAPPDDVTVNALTTHPAVTWVGEVPNVESYLRASAILLLPTAREGLPQAALEAQSCGVPVVSWRVTGVVDAVRDGFTGVLVSYGDEKALAAASVNLLEDAGLRGRMSEAAHYWVVNRYERSIVATQNAEYLLRRLNSGSRS